MKRAEVGLSLFLAIAWCQLCACEQKSEPPAAPPPEVVVTDVIQKDVPIYQEWVGSADGNINAQIRARVRGYLQSRDYAEGSLVRTGDLLFAIDPRPYQAALDQAKGELGRADAALTKTQQDVARYTPLAAEGAISRQELDNAVQANRANKATVDAARANVEKAQLDVDWTQLKSPIDGIAGISVASVGDLISESSVLTTVSQVDPIKVSFNISEQEYLRLADRIQLDKPNHQEATLELILADGNVHAHGGTASAANRQVDVKTGTMTIVSVFPNPGNRLRPGQYAKVRAVIESRPGALLVPQRAVQEIQGTYQVAVVGADNKVAMRTVKPGPRVGNLWVIDDGLKSGERIVSEGLQKVRDGVTVSPKPAASK
ncbi:MAG: efflux RND transporter periplasmic adaptor subunit [Deltaproteobacteria bacterium]|nr:efflux RND transporter periplasmic adaptor subunit [Deltaproteobacteria bacterium]MBI3391390.1 efflux RND transporter periplasmic adaptor subunit [Deltaproteobacteria bacterium]